MNRFLCNSFSVLVLLSIMTGADSAFGQAEGIVLTVDRDTRAVSIDNPGSEPFDFDLYYVQSEIGSMNPGNWLSLDEQGVAGDTWQVTGDPPGGTANSIAELNPDAVSTLAASGSLPIGDLFSPVFLEFGQDPEDLTFFYSSPNMSPGTAPTEGAVNYVGDKQYNNIVLTVDPSTGEAVMQNESEITVSIDSYRIASEDDALLSGDGQWNSLEDQGASGGDWFEIGEIGPSQLGELQRDGTTLLPKGRGFHLGTIFDTSKMQDLDFEFLLTDDSDFFPGAVEFGDLPTLAEDVPGDYNRDGIVNAADYTLWRDTLGDTVSGGSGADGDGDGMITSSDYGYWKDRFGNVSGSGAAHSATVPEPSAVLLYTLGLACLAPSLRFKQGRR